MRARIATSLLLGLLLGASGSQPADGAAFAPEDAVELQSILADAQETQNICYSYVLSVDDRGGAEPTYEGGASWTTQPVTGMSLTPVGQCSKHVELTAYVNYTSAASETEDSARYDVSVVNLPTQVTDTALQGVVAREINLSESSLVNSYDDAIYNAMVSLPGIVASTGAAPYLPLEVNTEPLAEGEALTDKPGSDVIRENQLAIIFFVLVFLSTLFWAGWTVVVARQNKALEQRQAQRRKRRARQQPNGPQHSDTSLPFYQPYSEGDPSDRRPS